MVGRAVVRTAATTAVVVGTAGAVSHAQQNKYAQQNAAQQQQQQMQQPQQQQPAGPAPDNFDEQLIQIQKLSAMKDQGLLTEAEFNAKKAQILGI
jgi:uncharacterized membrane protein YebE (DUF533 family)